MILVENLQRLVEVFQSVDPEFPINQLEHLLFVAKRPGCRPEDIRVGLGVNTATVTRFMDKYGDSGRRGKGNSLGMLLVEENPEDRRSVLLYLSPKGNEFLKKLSACIGGGK